MKSQLIEMDICVTPVKLAKAKMIELGVTIIIITPDLPFVSLLFYSFSLYKKFILDLHYY